MSWRCTSCGGDGRREERRRGVKRVTVEKGQECAPLSCCRLGDLGLNRAGLRLWGGLHTGWGGEGKGGGKGLEMNM